MSTATLQARDVVQDGKGWFYRVREMGENPTYDSFSEFDGTTTPVVDGDSVSWPVALLVRDGQSANSEPGEQNAVRMALFLNGRR